MHDCDRVSGMENTLAVIAADTAPDPVTRLILGWLAGKRTENTRKAYARDIGILATKGTSRAPSWLAWCRAAGVGPVTGVTEDHINLYARTLESADLAPSSAARKLSAVADWYKWLARRRH